ncbi:MAG: hypothetical protein EBS21_11480 [Sphingomonadaceae bacterium]|nr:hypothetical protein [Sphingomonadaceae bacterium]
MSKATSPSWPDPTEWLKRLDDVSRERAVGYLSATDQRNRKPGSYTDNEVLIESACTLHAAGVLSSIATALHELPAFKDHPATVVLNDIVIALHDLAVGGAPALLQRGERRSDIAPIGQDTVIGYMALSVRLLREGHDFTDAAARAKVAELMAKHGFRGRKGDILSASTLQDWQDAYAEMPAEHPVRVAIERRWSEWTSNPDWQCGHNLSAALNWIEKLAERPEFQNKSARKRS